MVDAFEEVKAMPHATDVCLHHDGAVVLATMSVNVAIIDAMQNKPGRALNCESKGCDQ